MKRWCNIYFNDILMCQQHMKRWCNNVDWSLESVLLNINNDNGKQLFPILEIVISLEIKD